VLTHQMMMSLKGSGQRKCRHGIPNVRNISRTRVHDSPAMLRTSIGDQWSHRQGVLSHLSPRKHSRILGIIVRWSTTHTHTFYTLVGRLRLCSLTQTSEYSQMFVLVFTNNIGKLLIFDSENLIQPAGFPRNVLRATTLFWSKNQ
jgi:hypothetical protein